MINITPPLSALQVRELWKVFRLPIAAVLLLYFKVVPSNYNHYIVIIAAILVSRKIYFKIQKEKCWSLKDIGCTFKDFKRALLPYTIVFCIGILGFYYSDNIKHLFGIVDKTPSIPLWKLLFVSFSYGALQQFLFQGYLYKRINEITENKVVICVIIVIFFTFVHIFFENSYLVLTSCFLLGTVLAILYNSHPILFLAATVHGIYNALAIYLCLFKPLL